jgi:hypothetical protein
MWCDAVLQAVIMVVDSTDEKRIALTKTELFKLLSNEVSGPPTRTHPSPSDLLSPVACVPLATEERRAFGVRKQARLQAQNVTGSGQSAVRCVGQPSVCSELIAVVHVCVDR